MDCLQCGDGRLARPTQNWKNWDREVWRGSPRPRLRISPRTYVLVVPATIEAAVSAAVASDVVRAATPKIAVMGRMAMRGVDCKT